MRVGRQIRSFAFSFAINDVNSKPPYEGAFCCTMLKVMLQSCIASSSLFVISREKMFTLLV